MAEEDDSNPIMVFLKQKLNPMMDEIKTISETLNTVKESINKTNAKVEEAIKTALDAKSKAEVNFWIFLKFQD